MQYLHSFPLQIYFQLPSFVEDGVRNEEHYQESRNIVLYKYGVSILNIWQVQAGTDQTERYKPIRQWKTNSCAAANFKIETLQGPAKTINRRKNHHPGEYLSQPKKTCNISSGTFNLPTVSVQQH